MRISALTRFRRVERCCGRNCTETRRATGRDVAGRACARPLRRGAEGSLIRLGAYASLGAREITVDFARETLKDVLAAGERTITIDEIKREVAAYFGIKVADLASKRRTQNLVYPRQIAMHICRQLTSSSLPVIGKMFGGRDHSTVIHSLKLIEQKMKTSVEVNTTIETIVRRVQG